MLIINMTNDLEMPISAHIEELRQRLIFVLLAFIVITGISLFNVKTIVQVLQLPAQGIKFLQLAPGEYFFASFKVAVFTGLLLSTPFLMVQLLLFVLPGLNQTERTVFIILTISSTVLFFTGLLFGYFILIPAALGFFIKYGSNIVEPLWSFEQYFNFILLLLISNGLAFEIPIIQILLSFFNLISGEQMLSIWRYVIVFSTILGAVLTPSTDPFTQLLLSIAILSLYLLGLMIIFSFRKYFPKFF
uniref:Sec-independent periplasmic protein translocase n=1 Tax=Corynoplastis japonica TaxID=700918 RepID=A0A1X9PTW1_9RHOD|nr:sec-independent periplasmic protein translocase [Corynoplastis japonica]